jgi:hypothetical protein
MCEQAHALYACDGQWWEHNNGLPDLHIEKWTQDAQAAKQYGLNIIASEAGDTFSRKNYIHQGGNSGFQAVNLAILFGAKEIALLGYDMQITDNKRHFFGEHEGKMNKPSPYHKWVKSFENAAKHLHDVHIVNCTRKTALTCFEMKNIEDL